jgi:hypothetical protein
MTLSCHNHMLVHVNTCTHYYALTYTRTHARAHTHGHVCTLHSETRKVVQRALFPERLLVLAAILPRRLRPIHVHSDVCTHVKHLGQEYARVHVVQSRAKHGRVTSEEFWSTVSSSWASLFKHFLHCVQGRLLRYYLKEILLNGCVVKAYCKSCCRIC